MDASHLIAQILGLVYLVVGIGVVVDGDRYRKLIAEFSTNVAFGYFGGVLALIAGYLIITFGPGVWTVSYEGLITLIGWMALIKGVLYLVWPGVLTNLAGWWANKLHVATVICFVFGIALSYYGYML